jgi:hypothetical protein
MGYPLPDDVPDHLEPLIYAASLESNRKFPRPNQAKKRIKSLIFAFAEILYAAAKSEEITPHLAVDVLKEFVDEAYKYDDGLIKYLPKYYEKVKNLERFEVALTQEIEKSDKWQNYIKKFAKLVEAKRRKPESDSPKIVAELNLVEKHVDDESPGAEIRGERDPMVAARRAELRNMLRPGKPITTQSVCRRWDSSNIKVPETWIDDGIKTWQEAFQHQSHRGRVKKIVSKDSSFIRFHD